MCHCCARSIATTSRRKIFPLAVFGIGTLGSRLAILDLLHLGSSMSLRSFLRMGSSIALAVVAVPAAVFGDAKALLEKQKAEEAAEAAPSAMGALERMRAAT